MAVTQRPRESFDLAGVFDQVRRILEENPLLCRAFAVLAALHPIYQIFVWLPMQWRQTSLLRDIVVYYNTAVNAAGHRPLYQPLPNFGPDGHGTPYLYPPQFALLLAPLGRLSFHDFCVVWYVALVAGFWVFAWTLDRMAAERASIRGTLLWGLALAATPGAYEAMSEGQIDPVVWALFGLALATRYRGVFLGILTHVKLFGLFPILMSVRSEGKRVAVPAVLTVIAGFAAGVAAFGPASLMHWVQWALPIPGQGYFSPYNLSLSFLLLRVGLALGMWRYPGGPLPAGPHLFLQVCLAAGIAGSIWATRRMPAPKNYIVVLLAVLLLSPTCWYTYDPLVYTLIALGIKNRESAR